MPLDPYLPGGLSLDGDRIAALESTLKKERASAADEIGRLKRQLSQARDVLPATRDAAAVADNLAVQQQIDALRLALREKDKVIEGLNVTIRGLEDRLEDHYRELDTLVLKLNQHDRRRAEVEDQYARLERKFRRLLAVQSQAASTSVPAAEPTSAFSLEPHSRPSEHPPSSSLDMSADPNIPATRRFGTAKASNSPYSWLPEPVPSRNPPTPAELRRAAALLRGRRGSEALLRGLLAALLGALLVLLIAAGLWWSGLWWPTARPGNGASLPDIPPGQNGLPVNHADTTGHG